jgi:hypothetical protein
MYKKIKIYVKKKRLNDSNKNQKIKNRLYEILSKNLTLQKKLK